MMKKREQTAEVKGRTQRNRREAGAMSDLPAWFQPVRLDGWPTRVIESAGLRYALPIHQTWQAIHTGEAKDNDASSPYADEQYRGGNLSDGLSVQFTTEADPAAPLEAWAEVSYNLRGHALETVPSEAEVQTLELVDYGSDEDAVAAWGVDDVQSLVGLARILKPDPALARFYIVLARRDRWAWKFNLSFMSACLPGTADEVVRRNDHVRAGASFGFLKLG